MKSYVLATQQEWGVEVYRTFQDLEYLTEAPRDHWSKVERVEALATRLRQQRPRYAFFVNWSDIVPSDVLALTECVNFHCTPLPYGRGGAPIENLLLRGHTETVITAHRMVEELDAGPIYATRGPVSLAGTKAQILERFIEPVVDLIRYIVDAEPEPSPQVGDVVNFKRLDKATYEAFWKGRA